MGWAGPRNLLLDGITFKDSDGNLTTEAIERLLVGSNIEIKDGSTSTWFAQTWWDRRARYVMYTNVNDAGTVEGVEPKQLTSLSIETCPCHSGGRGFEAHNGPIGTPGVVGKGYTLEMFIVVKNPDKDPETYKVSTSVSPINYTNAYPLVENNKGTNFGDPDKVGEYLPSSRRYTGDSQEIRDGLTRHLYEFIIDPEKSPIIEPGGCAYLVLRPDSWVNGSSSGDSNNTAIVLVYTVKDGVPSFSTTVEKDLETKWIWVRRDGEWHRELELHKFSRGKGWEVVE